METPAPPSFASDDDHERSLRDAAFWEPYTRATLRSAGLPDAGPVRTHLPTTRAAVLVGDHLVRLHYEEWFGGDKGLLQTAPTRTAGTTSGRRGRGG